MSINDLFMYLAIFFDSVCNILLMCSTCVCEVHAHARVFSCESGGCVECDET